MRSRSHPLVTRCLAALLSLTTPGCSLIFVDGGEPPRCSTSTVAPVFDGIFGGLFVFQTVLAVTSASGDYENSATEASIALSLGFTALFIASAYYGISRTSRCKAWHRNNRHESAGEWSASRQPPPERNPLRAAFSLPKWRVQLIGVPAVEAERVAVRIEGRSVTRQMADCGELTSVVDGLESSFEGGYSVHHSGGLVREVVLVRMDVDALAHAASAEAVEWNLCGQSQRVDPDSRTKIRTFLETFVRRGGKRGDPAAHSRRSEIDDAPPPLAANVTADLDLDGMRLTLLAQPTAHPNIAFVLVPDPAPGAEASACPALGLSAGPARTSLPLTPWTGAADTFYSPVQYPLLRGLAESEGATITACGEQWILSTEHRAAIAAFIEAVSIQVDVPGPVPMLAEP